MSEAANPTTPNLDVVFTTSKNRVATVTMNRPESRNALNRELRRQLPEALAAADTDPDIDVVVLTGTDPAFCAGLDLKELGAGENRIDDPTKSDAAPEGAGPFRPRTKPLIGAVNGVAITGGFELALNCDFLIASERAAFADTHARVGVMPGWGLSVLLSQAVGVRRAREMSLSGNFMNAAQATEAGLVNRVVPHDDLLAVTQKLAEDIVGNDQAGVRQMLATYESVSRTTVAEGWDIEARNARQFQRSQGFDPDEVERRRLAIVERGRSQTSADQEDSSR